MRAGGSLSVSSADAGRLRSVVQDRNAPQKQVWRAEIVLLTAEGVGTSAIMRRTGKSKTCVWRWQERFTEEGFDGLPRDKTRPSRMKPLGAETAEHVVALTLTEPPGETTHWTSVLMAKAAGLSVSSVQRIWRTHGLQPHRMRQFKLSNDPRFVAKLRDVVGLYVDPPAHAIVLSVDDRTQPGLPLKKGRAGTMTHDYERHGTTTLFAAMNVLDGTVIGRNMQRHRHQEFYSLPQCHREAGFRGQDDPRHRRQRRRPQASQCLAMARTSSAMPLHPNIGFLAQRCRGLLRNPDKAQAQARRLPIRHRPASRDQPLPRRAQSAIAALHLDCRPRQNHRRRQARAPKC